MVDVAQFRTAVKKISKYGLILSRLCDFGFAISDFNGIIIDKKADVFTVEYLDNPNIISTIKTYCDNLDDFQ